MGQILPAFPVLPQHEFRVVMGAAEFAVRLTWRARPACWYMDLYAADGTALLLGRRLSAQGSPWHSMRVPGLPDGELFVSGLDAYARTDLGAEVQVVFYPTAELAVVPGPADFVVRL